MSQVAKESADTEFGHPQAQEEVALDIPMRKDSTGFWFLMRKKWLSHPLARRPVDINPACHDVSVLFFPFFLICHYISHNRVMI